MIGYTLERLLREGAREAFVTPILMKKGRPGHLLTAIVPEGREAALGALLMRETGTLGYRVRRTGRVILKRAQLEVGVEGGTVRIKTAALGGEADPLRPGVRGLPPHRREDRPPAARGHRDRVADARVS